MLLSASEMVPYLRPFSTEELFQVLSGQPMQITRSFPEIHSALQIAIAEFPPADRAVIAPYNELGLRVASHP